MDFAVITTSAVVLEITDDCQLAYLESCINENLIETEDDGSLFDIITLKERYRGLTYADASVLELALRKKSKLITADGLLRKAGVKEENVVHGTLWIIETMHYNRLLTIEDARKKIEELIRINKRISPELCFSMIKKIEEEETAYHFNK